MTLEGWERIVLMCDAEDEQGQPVARGTTGWISAFRGPNVIMVTEDGSTGEKQYTEAPEADFRAVQYGSRKT